MNDQVSPSTPQPTMRAVVQHEYGDTSVLKLERVARPSPLPTEVLVRVHAAGVNPVDWKTRQGSGMAHVLGPTFTLGWDVAGIVEEVGFGVTTLAPGDRVYGMPWFPRAAGGYADYVTAPSRQFAKMPTSIDYEHAAAVPLAGLTAWQLLVDTAHARAGQRVVINAAAGGVGHLAVQMGRHLDVHVTAIASRRHHAWLIDLGADDVVDYTTLRFEDYITDADIFIDLIGQGVDNTSLRAVQVLQPGGLLIVVPGLGLDPDLSRAVAARAVHTTNFLVEPDGAALTTIAQLIDNGDIHPEVAAVLPLAEVGRAHTLGETNRTRGKIVLSVVEN